MSCTICVSFVKCKIKNYTFSFVQDSFVIVLYLAHFIEYAFPISTTRNSGIVHVSYWWKVNCLWQFTKTLQTYNFNHSQFLSLLGYTIHVLVRYVYDDDLRLRNGGVLKHRYMPVMLCRMCAWPCRHVLSLQGVTQKHSDSKYIEAETKWQPFWRGHFHMRILEWKWL